MQVTHKILSWACLGLLIAVQSTAVAAPVSAKKITVAVIPKGTTHEFWKSIHAGANKAARELGVEVLWKGPLREDDRSAQIDVMEDMTVRGVSGIVLAPLDDSALRAPIEQASRSGVPVVVIDSSVKTENYVSFVATDNFKGGYLGGKQLVALLGGKGKVAMLRYAEGSASTMEREKGFLQAMKEAPGIQLVSANQYGGATTETAYKASENLLSPFKSADGKAALDGIFTPNESTTFGMLRALQDAGLAGKLKFVGFDISDKLLQALKDKQIQALVAQNPMKMGYEGVKAIVASLRGQKVDKRIDTGVSVVTPENLVKPEVKDLIAPDLKSFL